jgi:hypothetical protein
MKKDDIRAVIENTLKQGSKTPGVFSLPKIMSIKLELETCSTTDEVVKALEDNRDFICTSFGLNSDIYTAAITIIKGL